MEKKPFIDRAIATVAPGWALNRERARLRLTMAERVRAEYTGASNSRRAANWRRTRLDANSELNPRVMAALREVARDMVRNNPWAHRALHAWANNLVGTGITFQVYRNGKVDDQLNALARKFFDTTACDANGMLDLYGLQLQAAKSIVEGGAVLARRRWRRASDGLPVPFQIQLLEPDYLDPGKHGAFSAKGGAGPYAINGIEFSPLGKREAYWLYSGHPGGVNAGKGGSTRVAAADIIHCYRADRIEQEHGASWFAPVIAKLNDFADYDDAQLMRQKIAACFSVFKISDEDAIETSVSDDNPGVEELEPGLIHDLKAGQDIKFASPPGVDGFGDYSKVSMQAVSTGLNLPYFVLTGDLSAFNFASGRMGWLEFQRSLSSLQWSMFIPQFCRGLERWFVQALAIQGVNVDGVSMEWTPPRREMISPENEIPAIRDAIRSGQMTISEAAKARGVDPDVFFAEWAADAAKLDELGLIFDSDPRRVTAVGNPTAPTAQQGGNQ